MTKSPAKPLDIQALYAKAKGNATVIIDRAAELEAKGWETWLTTIFPFAFPSEFSWFHRKFWDAWWDVCLAIKHKRPVPPDKQNFMLLWGRALAKSSSGTPSSLMKAALAGRSYSLYLSKTIDQATSHLANVRFLITHPDSRLVEFYPHMALTSFAPTSLGLKSKDTENVFITTGGSVFRALGIESASRGLILAGKRPDDFNIDDIDTIPSSLVVTNNNLRRLTQSILLTRDVSSDLVVTTKILQNIVADTSVVNQIHTGKSDAFAERTTIGPVNTFDHLAIESYMDDNGKLRHKILPESKPSWSAVSIPKAQSILDLIGLDAFMAECQNDFSRSQSGRVIPEYNERVQIITWSEFERVYGERRIPAYWQCDVGLDIGYSEGMYPHYSAWVFATTSAMNSPLPRKVFIYRTMSFQGVSIDDQADAVKEALLPDERIRFWRMSHEKTGEWMTLNAKHKLPFSKFTHYKSEDGVAQWRHLSRVDKTQPHPFKEDRLLEDGTYELGDCMLFYIVDDEQVVRAVDDRGHRLLREQVATWEYVPVKVTDTGQTVQRPSKINDDLVDAARCGIFAYFNPEATDFTPDEKMFQTLPEAVRVKPEELTEQGRVTQIMHLKKALEKREQRRHEAENEWVGSR